MSVRTPSFWQDRGVVSTLLLPLTLVWQVAGWLRRVLVTPAKAAMPVICIGNITSGGTGKTPLVSTLAKAAAERGWHPVILMRGHGGHAAGPLLVTDHTLATEVGDEAILLHHTCPVVVSRDRREGAALIAREKTGNIILMDDGMQNPQLIKDQVIAVFNGRRGLENQRLIPAGPLRETLASGLAKTDLAVITGADETGLAETIRQHSPQLPVVCIDRHLDPHDLTGLAGRPVIAFAGIGDNTGFFDMLADAGLNLIKTRGFADHHFYTEGEITSLVSQARAHDAVLATTTKDMSRLAALSETMPIINNIHAVRLITTLPTSLLDRILSPAVE